MDEVAYKGFGILAVPKELADESGWTVEVEISTEKESEAVFRNFSAGNIYPDRDLAVAHCLNFAKQIIDGQHPDLSVSDL